MANQWIRVNPNDNDFTRRMKYLSSTGQASTGQSSSGDESSFTPNREQQAFQDYRTVKTNEINTGLDLSTASGMEAYIWNNYSGKERDDAYATLDAAYSTKGSKFYDPYRNQATNQSYLDDLKNLGVQVPETVTSDWLGQMAQQYSPYYKLSQDSGNPNSPGKKATTEQKIAYDVFKLWGDEDTTEKAENEWADMKAKVTYWAQKGLSDKEIKDKIDMKKYPTLSKIDESRKIGNIVTMNRAIGYSGDALDGVIWKARNGYGDDMDDFQAAVRYKLGQGRGDRSTAKQIAQRTVGTSEYNPYVGGSNDDDARMTMGVKSWDNEWLKAHQSDMFAAGQEDLWIQMDKELGNYEAAKKQYDILDKWVSGYNYDFDAENIRAVVDKLSADLDDRLNNTSGLYMDEIDGAGKLKSLTDMDEGRRTGKPVGLSDELNYRKEDVLAEMVQRYFLQNGQKITGEQAAYAVSHADEMDKEAEKNRAEPPEEDLQDNVEPVGLTEPGDIKDNISALPETDPLSKVDRTPGAKTASPDWKTQYETRTKDYQSSHPTNGSFDNRFMIPIMDMDGTSGSLRDKPRLADGAVSDTGRKAPEQKYLNTLNGKVYTRSQIEQTLTNAFMGLEPDADETDALRMLSHSIPWAFQSKRVIYSTNMNWSAFGNNGQKVFDAVDASESGYATASDQAQLVLAFYDDAAAAAAEGMNIGEYYKKNPDAYTDVQGIIDTINGRRDKQLAEDTQREEDAKTQRLAEAKTIVGKLASGQEMDETDQSFIAGITPNGSYAERENYMGSRSANSEFFRSIDYDTQLFDVQNEWFDQQREIVGSSFDPFEQATKRQGITELMEQGIVFDAKLAESAGMTLEEYYKATGTTLNLQERFQEAQRAWEARESPENRTEEQNTGIGLLGVVWSGAKMGTVDTAAGFVGFAADMRSLSAADTHRSVKDGWMNYMSGGGIQGMVESRSAYRAAVLSYANSLNESDPQRAEAIRGAVYEAAANGEDIFNVAFDITLDKLERAYESLQKVNAIEQEYIDTHATEFEKNTVRQWRSAVSSLEKMAISAGLTAVGAPGAVAGAVAFFPGTYDSTYRAEVASNGGDKTSAAVYAGISALIDTITEQSFMSKWYNFGGEAAQSWLLNIQKSQLAKIGPAGQAGNLAHRAAAYFLGWAATASAETMQELGQDGVSAIWDFVYHGRDVNWLKDQFDFINNPEARENLADTVASTLMSVTLSFNGQQIFGRGNVTREGDGATAFSSYNVLQRNRLIGEQMRKLDAQRKVDEQTLAEDTSDLTVDLGEGETTTPEAPAAQEQQPPAGQYTDVFGDPANGTPMDPNAPHVQEAPEQQEQPAAEAPVAEAPVAEAPVAEAPEAEAPAAPAESVPVASASPDTETPAAPEQNAPAAEKPISPIKKRDPERTRLENGQEPRFVTQANLKLSGMKFDVQRINKCLDQLTDMQADLQNLSAEEFFDKYAGNFRSMIEAVNYARDEGFNQGLEISDDISNSFDSAFGNFSTEAFQVIMNSLVTEFNGELGQRATQISETIRDVDLKFALYTAYTTPGFREEIIGQLTERYTADAIMAGRLTEDADAKNAVKATEDAKNELDTATEEQNQAEAALQTAQQNLDNVTANRGQEGWSPKQEIAAAKGVDTAKKNAETSRKKAKNSKEKYDRAKENSDAVLDAKRESLEAEARDTATAQVDQEAAEFTTNVDHIDEPIVPDTPAPNAEPTTTIRTNEENAALAQDANEEASRLDSLTPEQEAAETQQNAEGLAKAEEEEENLPMQGPKLPITTTFGNRLRSEAVNEKGKQILTKAQTDSIEKAIIGDNDMADFYNDLSAEDLIRFVNDFKGKTRSRTASFMRNWMETELQQKAAVESGIDKADVIKKLKSEVRKAIKAKDYSIVEKAMEKYIEDHEDLFDIALDADGIYIDGENISFNGAFSEDMSEGVGDAPADTDTPDINDQMESLLPEQEEPEGEPMELLDEEEAPAAEAPAAEQPAEASAAEDKKNKPRLWQISSNDPDTGNSTYYAYMSENQMREYERMWYKSKGLDRNKEKKHFFTVSYATAQEESATAEEREQLIANSYKWDEDYMRSMWNAFGGPETDYYKSQWNAPTADQPAAEQPAELPSGPEVYRKASDRAMQLQEALGEGYQVHFDALESGFTEFSYNNQMYKRVPNAELATDGLNVYDYAAPAEVKSGQATDQIVTDTEQPATETPAAEAPKEEKPKRKRTPKKPKPVIAEEVSMESTSDSLTQSLSDDLKASIGGDKLAQAIIKQINDAQNIYNKAQAEVMDDTKKVDITALTQTMDAAKEKIQQMTESFNRRVGMLQRKAQADQRAEARKSVDRSEARQAEVNTLLEGVAKRAEKILDKAKNSKAKNPKPLNYKDARDLVADLRSILDVGLATMENDIGANEIGKLAETVKAFTPAFDAVNELSELSGEEAAPGSIKSLNAAFIRAGKALVAAQANRNASDEGKQAFLNARTALTAARNKLMAYAHDMDARLVQMTPVESRAYADLSRPGRRTDITAGPETQARQSPIKTFQRLANDLHIGHYDVDRKTIPRRALGVYHPFSDAIGIGRNHANDAYVTMHEIGHAIEERTSFHGDMSMISAADPALMSQYSAADQPHEAVAEFVRTYMMDRQSAISVYGQATVDRFETECKANNIWKEVSRAALDIHDYTMANVGSQAQSRISNFQHRKQPMGLRRTIHEGLRAAIANTTDDTIAAKDFDDLSAKDRSDNAMSVRQRLRFGKFASRQGRGLITEQYSTPDNQITGVSFAQAISEDETTGKTLLKTQEDYDILSRYMLLLQAKTRYNNAASEALYSLPATATQDEIDAAIRNATAKTTVFGDSITIDEINAEIKNIKDNYGNVVTAQKQLAAWWQTFMRDWMPVAGVSAQTVEDLIEKYPNYCPTQRDMPDGRNGRNTKNSQNSNWAYGFQRIKGSDLDVINPLITMQSTIVKTVEAARRNEAVGAIVQALNTSQDLGEYAHIVQGDFDITTTRADTIKDAVASAFGKAVQSGLNPQMSTIDSIGMFIDDVTEFRKTQYTSEPNTVAYQHDGDVTLVKFDDPVLYDAVMAGNPQVGPIASTLGKLTRNMSLLTTGMNVLFTAKNLVRDYQQGTVWGSWNSSIVSPLGLAKWIAAASEVIRGEAGKNSKHLAEYKAMGGEGYGSINMPSSERQANNLMQNLYEMYGMNAAQKGGLFARKALIDWIDTVNGVIEQTTRYVEYRYGKHDLSTPEGRAKAFLAAQDATVDFARKGNGQIAASLRAMIPFYNAALQGTWQVFDAAVDSDQKSRRAVRAAKLAVNNMILGAMSYMALQMIGSDEDKEWYEKLPLAIRLDNIIIPFKDSETHARQFIRLPVAQNWASRAFYATGLALARGNNGDEDGMDILAVAGNILSNWVQTDFIFAPELAIMKNQSWTGSTLVPSRMEGWRASEQFNQTTPEIFKFLSRGLSQAGVEISPIHLQYLAQQHSGVLGQVFIPMMSPDSLDNYQLNPVGQVLRTLRNSWTIDPAYTNDINDAYYEGKSFIENIPAVIKEHGYSDRLSTNLSDEEAQDAVDTAAQMTGIYGALTAIDKQIGEIRAQQNTIIENTELSANEKEVQRRNLQREIVKLEEQAVGIINEYRMQYCTGTNPLMHTVFGGAHAGKASVLASKPTQFLDDYRAGEEYIKTAVDVYTATGESVIPNPATSITSNKEQFKIKAFAEDDGTPIWDSYVNAYQTQYKKAYATYDWKSLSDEQKVAALKACGTSANKAAKAYFLEWYRDRQR